jgi:hypothetical protein
MLQLLMHTKGCREVILYWNPGRCLIINQPVTSKENFINIDFYFILNFLAAQLPFYSGYFENKFI